MKNQNMNDDYLKILYSFWIGFSAFVILFAMIVAIIVNNTNQVEDTYRKRETKFYSSNYEKEKLKNPETENTIQNNIASKNEETTVSSKWDYTEFEKAPFTTEEFWSLQESNADWYDNGIFSSYISKAYPTDIWEYSADIYPEMSENPYEYTGFQIYTHQCEEMQQVYFYLVPISEMPIPEVYVYDEVSNTMKLVFLNGEIIE